MNASSHPHTSCDVVRSLTGESDDTSLLKELLSHDAGQDIVEYALLGAIIGIAAIAIWQQLATTVGVVYGETTGTGVNGVQALSACTPDPDGGGC